MLRFHRRLPGTKATRANDAKLSVSRNDLLIEQPRPAGGRKAASNRLEGSFAPIIVVARHSVQRRFDTGQNLEGFGQISGLFDQIAGKTNELRRTGVDLLDHRFKIRAIAFMMDIGEMDEPMSRLALRKPHSA